ncbi:hypothetical protein M878_00425 [Streptomyces roseochromogenus subsp. oscitans DS 12.976]|uniref:Uncharacterized protein n=1 Tax=Streptomyces roseochromogenus subsp. oscitans DS 12.976 TaxID=1352936 RepID=V6KX63_STRRC|nr:hypothetical protein M878_00425 [Streptomyces roseochromogenus subsp. oscitans DS 12.976]
MTHTLAFVHSEKHRWAVAADGPNDADGNCCHVQPDVATNIQWAFITLMSRRPPHNAVTCRKEM